MSVLHQSLGFANPDDVVLWAACCLGFFGFLRAGEFALNPTLHLTMAHVQVDSSTNPQGFRVFIKCSKTDPFRCFIFLGRGSFPLCPVVSLTGCLHLCGPETRPLFIDQSGAPLSRSRLSSFPQAALQSAGIPEGFSDHGFQIGAAAAAAGGAFLAISLGLWGIGLVERACCMCVLWWRPSFLSRDGLLGRYGLLRPSFGLLFWVPSDLGISLWGAV